MTSGSIGLLVALVVWGVVAVGLGIVMSRRGYRGFGWGLVAAVFGPIGVLLAVLRHVPNRPAETRVAGRPGPGPVNVLIGIDGSDAAIAGAVSAINLLDKRVAHLSLATVAPLDAGPADEQLARTILAEGAAALGRHLARIPAEAGQVVLRGPAADALRRHAVDAGYDVLAIGAHGRGASHAVLGSVAAALVRDCPVPVLVHSRRHRTVPEPAAGSPEREAATASTVRSRVSSTGRRG